MGLKKSWLVLTIFLFASCDSIGDDTFEDVTISGITVTTTCTSTTCDALLNGKDVFARIVNDTCASFSSAVELASDTGTASCSSSSCTATLNTFEGTTIDQTTFPGGDYCAVVYIDVDGSHTPTSGDVQCLLDVELQGPGPFNLDVTTCNP